MGPTLAGRDLDVLAQARLAARAAHHFNNCLAAVIANLEMALEDSADGRPHDPALVELALDAARRAAGTCRALQNFARPPGAPPSPLNLGDVLRQVEETSPQLHWEGPVEGLWVLAEESELLAAVHTLVNHSGPFIVKRGHLWVAESLLDPGMVVLTMEGDGPPCSVVPLSRLFEPLAGHPDHDIDLSQAGSMVRRAGGMMDASLSEDSRLQVRIYLPLASPPNEEGI